MNVSHRMEWRWIVMGPLLGYFSGLVATTVLVGVPFLALMGPFSIPYGVVAGIVGGGPMGAVVGLVAGLPLAVLVGPDLPLRTAVNRAGLLGAALPPLVLVGAVLWWPEAWWFGFSTKENLMTFGWWPYPLAALLGYLVSTRTALVDMPRPPVS